jgi:hypothetical protein
MIEDCSTNNPTSARRNATVEWTAFQLCYDGDNRNSAGAPHPQTAVSAQRLRVFEFAVA